MEGNVLDKLEVLKKSEGSYWAERITAELEYALKLSKVREGRFDTLIKNVVDRLVYKHCEDGAISKASAVEAENMLADISMEAKQFKMLCVAHAHIDMNWMWRFDETVAITLDTFRTMLDLMKEYPEFTFSQSQASVYSIVQEYDPAMLEEIKHRVKEGRWEITASTWVEADKNMPAGESHARHILYTKRYLSGLFAIDPDSLNLDFEPDTFGHSLQVPEILSEGGIKYYYHCRGYDGHNIYRWEAPSGKSVIAYREPLWYISRIEPSMAVCVPEFCHANGIDTMLKVYGVGDHGGGPTRRDIERILDMSAWPVFPAIRFGKYSEFFEKLEKVKDRLPVVKDELNPVFNGCYTSQSRIKAGNSVCERRLNEAEAFCAVSSLACGYPYRKEHFERAWKRVLFNHFHDIIPGSGTIDTREYAMGEYQKALAAAGTEESLALKAISSCIDTSGLALPEEDIRNTVSEGAGVGYGIGSFKLGLNGRGRGKRRIFHIFNPAPVEREEVVELVIWDWEGDKSRIVFKDARGVEACHQLIAAESLEYVREQYWGHKYLTVLLKAKVQPYGYNTYIMDEGESGEKGPLWNSNPKVELPEKLCLENKLIKIEFDSRSLAITSFYDKKSGEELVDRARPAGVFRLVQEDDSQGMTSWRVGRHMSERQLGDNCRIVKKVTGSSLLRQWITYETGFNRSKMRVTVFLDYNGTGLDYDVECDWQEVGAKGIGVPQLNFCMPFAFSSKAYKYDVPFGVIERQEIDGDMPANSWVSAVGDSRNKTVMLAAQGRHGFLCFDNSISLTLLRSSYDPDPYPETGMHKFRFALRAVDRNASNRDLIDEAFALNHPLLSMAGTVHSGTIPASNSFIQLVDGNAAVSAVKMAENSSANQDIIVRLYETEGKGTTAVLKFFKEIDCACEVDINEKAQEAGNEIAVNGNEVRLKIEPYCVTGLCVRLKA